MRKQRLTWTIGGVGLVLCGVIGMLQYSVFGIAQVTGIGLDAVFAGSVLLFAIGLSTQSSVVARRPLGVAALAVVALWPLLIRAMEPLLPAMDAETFEAGLSAYRGAESVLTAVFYVNLLVTVAASLLASVQIARAKVVPAPWNWAPLWALITWSVATVVQQLLYAESASTGVQGYAEVAFLLDALAFLLRTVGLGTVALVLSARVRSDTVDVYRSR
ncbi:hypothetical protein [Microbacterium invictum]|uniref:Integral membrane protein n=1 Tax=Microbacterium invictum TaxID=515415 RepID=A0ABZ0VB59_9MICO|nr:hypothetical protein [Microbacterium invictum]WQB70873.1 hypothetical protein T9R20_02630 [Microbacterium invictum]